MAELKLEVSDGPSGTVVIDAAGHLDAHTFEQMEKQINALFESEKYKIIAKLDKLEYISSAGCGVFIQFVQEAQENDGNLVLLNATQNVVEVFDLLGLSSLFPMASSMEEAVGLFE